MITREDVVKAAEELELPEVLQKLASGENLEHPLNIFFGTAEEFFMIPERVQAEYGNGEVIPLWDNGSFDILTGVHLPSGKFLEFYIELDFDINKLQLWNYQQAILSPFQRIYECFIDEEEAEFNQQMKFFADNLHFNYLDDLMTFNNRDFEKAGEHREEFKKFRMSLS